jgi:hypothetical protein
LYGEDDCTVDGGAFDGDGRFFAIVYNSNSQGNLGDSVLKRFGKDLNPASLGGGINLPIDDKQDTGMYVACSTVSGVTVNNGITWLNDLCESNPGADETYGTADDGTIYYKEALENGLRGWVRETNSHTFSFLGADDDGTHNGISPANFGLTQLVEQATEGFLMSCLNCSPHSIPAVVETVSYSVDWPNVPDVLYIAHPPYSGTFSVIPYTAVNRWRDGIRKVISRLEVAVGHSKVEDWKIRLHKPRDGREGVYDPEVTRRMSKKIF